MSVYDEDVYTIYIIDLADFTTCFDCNTTTEVDDVEDGPYTSVMNSIMNISASVIKEGRYILV